MGIKLKKKLSSFQLILLGFAATIFIGALVLMLLAMSLCWVHGFGLTITNRWLRWVFSPLVAWPLMALGAWGVFLR